MLHQGHVGTLDAGIRPGGNGQHERAGRQIALHARPAARRAGGLVERCGLKARSIVRLTGYTVTVRSSTGEPACPARRGRRCYAHLSCC